MTQDQKTRVRGEIVSALNRQIDHFRCVAAVMEKVDFPKDFWDRSMDKMLKELGGLSNKLDT